MLQRWSLRIDAACRGPRRAHANSASPRRVEYSRASRGAARGIITHYSDQAVKMLGLLPGAAMRAVRHQPRGTSHSSLSTSHNRRSSAGVGGLRAGSGSKGWFVLVWGGLFLCSIWLYMASLSSTVVDPTQTGPARPVDGRQTLRRRAQLAPSSRLRACGPATMRPDGYGPARRRGAELLALHRRAGGFVLLARQQLVASIYLQNTTLGAAPKRICCEACGRLWSRSRSPLPRGCRLARLQAGARARRRCGRSAWREPLG